MSSQLHEATPREYEREAEATRHRLADTLNELQDRLTPGDMLNEVLSYAKGGGGTFFRAVSSAAKENPIPALLIGAGCAMFLAEKTGITQRLAEAAKAQPPQDATFPRGAVHVPAAQGVTSGRAGGSVVGDVGAAIKDRAASIADGARDRVASVGSAVSGTADVVKDRVAAVGQAVSGTADAVKDRVGSATAALGEGVSSVKQQVTQGVHDVRDKASDTADQLTEGARSLGQTVQEYSAAMGGQIADAADQTRQQATTAARQVKDQAKSLIEEQPLLVAAIGLAIGAVIAAVLPSTKAEDDFMGQTSDAVKETLGEVAAEQYQKVKEVAGSVTDQVKQVAEKEGLTAGGAADIARNVGDKVKRVVSEAAQSAGFELQDKFVKDKPV